MADVQAARALGTNPMTAPMLDKVVVHISVGEGGQKLINAENIVKTLTGQATVRTSARKTQPIFGIRKGQDIGCKTTLRSKRASTFLHRALETRQNFVHEFQFDENGNVSFGIVDHTDFSGMSYDPQIGIFGMDVIVSLKKPGYRVARRHAAQRRIPTRHRVTRDEAIAFLQNNYNMVLG
ncbi:MAG: 50S ribosomal protein L5 [Halobacteriota archaeon]